MDLMDLKPKYDTVEVVIKHPNSLEPLTNEDGSEMTVVLYAQHSKEYRGVMHEQQDRRIKLMQKKGATTNYSASDIERDAIELLSKCTKEWNITYGGETPKLTPAKAKEIYTEVFWLRSQVEEALTESLDFTVS